MPGFLRRLLLGRQASPAALITGVVGPDKEGGWSVFWVGDGASPPEVRAPSLTEAVDAATTAVVALYASEAPVPGAELQLAIYPWEYENGPIFDIDGRPGAFVARDVQGSGRTVSGATLEQLVDAAEPLPEVSPGRDAMFRWTRPVASLPDRAGKRGQA